MRYDSQTYSILETVAALDQQVVLHLVPTLTQALQDAEQKWGLGRNMALRYVWLFDDVLLGIIKNLDSLATNGLLFHSPECGVLRVERRHSTVIGKPFTHGSFQSDCLRKLCVHQCCCRRNTLCASWGRRLESLLCLVFA